MKKIAVLLSFLVFAPVVAQAQSSVIDYLLGNRNTTTADVQSAQIRSMAENRRRLHITSDIERAKDYLLYGAERAVGMAGVNNPGCYSQTRPIGQPMGKTKAAGYGAAIGGAAGYGFGGDGRGAAIGGALGALGGLVLGARGEKQYRQRQAVEAEAIRAQEVRMMQARQETEARAQAQAEAASINDMILINDMSEEVQLHFRSGNKIFEHSLKPGKYVVTLPKDVELLLAEVLGKNGRMKQLTYGRGKEKLDNNGGWRFFNPSQEGGV